MTRTNKTLTLDDLALERLTQGAYALAYQMLGQRADALDIVQDATTTALSHKSAPSQTSEAFRPWYFRVVRNRALDQLRIQQRFQHEEFNEDIQQPSKDENPEILYEKQQVKSALQRCLLNLSLNEREIILLKDYHCFSYIDIAEILDIPKGSVMSRLHRARLSLRTLIMNENLEER